MSRENEQETERERERETERERPLLCSLPARLLLWLPFPTCTAVEAP